MKKLRDLANWKHIGSLPPYRQLQVWLVYHGLDMARLARDYCGVTQGAVSATIAGKRTSAPILERIEALTGIPAAAWEKEQQ